MFWWVAVRGAAGCNEASTSLFLFPLSLLAPSTQPRLPLPLAPGTPPHTNAQFTYMRYVYSADAGF